MCVSGQNEPSTTSNANFWTLQNVRVCVQPESGQSRQQRSADRDKGKTMCLFHCRPAENSPISAEPRCLDVRGGTGGMCWADVTSSVPAFFSQSLYEETGGKSRHM